MAQCGTTAAYRKGCRCSDCRAANAEAARKYQRAYKARTGAYHSKQYKTKAPRIPCGGGCGGLVIASRSKPDGTPPTCRKCLTRSASGLTRRQYLAKVKIERAARGTPSGYVWTQGPCAWCGAEFAARGTEPARYCSRSCHGKMARAVRRGREFNATGTYTWSEVMRLFLAFNRCCAYCEQPIVGQPDPDHVVPLSRGGSNSITNILPCCKPCNSDKRDLSLSEWNTDRERRGKPPVRTSWLFTDLRFRHLTSVIPEAA